ncbi:MAG: glycosyltransferase family 2 protein, partial [Okeania sp. SIO3C4]|nr:glycosyltransferase family 2 protein [Okeania sp. SIO3C4]
MENKHDPLISIGIPTYNRPQRLRKTLASITCQTYSNLEIIVSDNCSSDDETQKVVQEFMETDPRIRYFRQDENIGMFYNFKFVFDVSKGDYFTWVADDDARSNDYIENCLNIFNEREPSANLVLVNSYSQLVDPDTNQ